VSVVTIIVTLFVTLNAFGNVPVFIAMLKDFDPIRQRKIITREMIFALLIMVIFSFFGELILDLFDLNIPILRIAGGMLLSLISLSMVFPKPHNAESLKQEPFLVPLAIPIITGPASISMVMVFSHQIQNQLLMMTAILCAWIPSFIALLLSSFLKRVLGEKLLLAFERLAGLILMFISIQMITTGIKQFIESSSFMGGV
jgi:multiple antibiotic resistance protein